MSEFINENTYGLGVNELAVVDASGEIIYRLPQVPGVGGTSLVTDGLGNAYWGVPNYTAGFSASQDAFGRMRVSNPETIFNSKLINNNGALIWDDQQVSPASPSVTSSTWSQNRASVSLAVDANTVCKRVRQTRGRFNYQPGKSQLVMMSGIMGNHGAGIAKCMGMFDDNNGIFVQAKDNTVGWGIRSFTSGAAVDNIVVQGDWNYDTLDGTGPSGITLDITKLHIFWFDMEWLGSGTVRCGFVVDGVFVLAHKFNHANTNDTVYMSTPNLPLRVELANDGSGAASTLEQVCASVMTEGGVSNSAALGTNHSLTTDNAQIPVADGTRVAIFGARLKSTNLGQAIDLSSISIINGAKNGFKWEIVINPTSIAGTHAFTDHPTSTSVQTFIGDETNIITGGYTIALGLTHGSKEGSANDAAIFEDVTLGCTIDGVRDEVYLCVTAYNVSAEIDATIAWKEVT